MIRAHISVDMKDLAPPDSGMAKTSGIPLGSALPRQFPHLFSLHETGKGAPPPICQGIHYRLTGFKVQIVAPNRSSTSFSLRMVDIYPLSTSL